MTETVQFPIAGMTCSSCVNRITRALRKLEGVEGVKVDLRHETGTVRRDPVLASDKALTVAISAAGYEANLDASVVVPSDDRPGIRAKLIARPRW